MDQSSVSLQSKRTSLYHTHLTAKAKMVDFAGWEMPIQYTSILEEHRAVRSAVGIFDVSHMGRFYLTGQRAGESLQRVLVTNVAKLRPGGAQYTLLCNEEGGILDDAVLYMLEEQRYLMVCNAVNAANDLAWLAGLMPPAGVTIEDSTVSTAMLALQGPKAVPLMKSIDIEADVDGLEYFTFSQTFVQGMAVFIARTGYTGEDGFEIITAAEHAAAVWSLMVEMGAKPCGLGARDTLRLEACLPLHGNDIGSDVNPFEAGLGWVVDLGKEDFLSKAALEAVKRRGPERRLAALEVLERAIPRHGYAVLYDSQQVGTVTSGGFSPTLEKGIALAYVPSALSRVGTQLEVDIRGRRVTAQVVRRPFYRRGY